MSRVILANPTRSPSTQIGSMTTLARTAFHLGASASLRNVSSFFSGNAQNCVVETPLPSLEDRTWRSGTLRHLLRYSP